MGMTRVSIETKEATANISPYAITGIQIVLCCIVIFCAVHFMPMGTFDQSGFGFSAWDGQHYLYIAQHGYTRPTQSNTAFLPIFPILIRAVHMTTGITYGLSGIILSNVFFVLSMVALYRLSEKWFDSRTAQKTLIFLLTFPTSFFLNMVYTESLSLFTILAFFYCLERDKWYAAMVFGFIATGTHDLGVLLVFPALFHWWKFNRVFWRLISMAIIPLSLMLYMAYLYHQFGDPLAFLHAQKAWGRQPLTPVISVIQNFNAINLHAQGSFAWTQNLMILVNGFCTLFMVVCSWFVWRAKEFKTGIKVFYTVTLLLTISTGTGNAHSPYALASFGRLVMILFPAYMVLSKRITSQTVFIPCVVCMLAVKVLLTAMFSNGYWVV